MSLQKDGKTTKRAPERHTEKGNNQWILERPMTTSRMGSQSASTVINMDTWQRNAEQRRKNKKQGCSSNVIKRDTLPGIAKASR